jgi:hypothetical protein
VLGREDCLDFLGRGRSSELGRQRLQQLQPIDCLVFALDRPGTAPQLGPPINLQASFPPEQRCKMIDMIGDLGAAVRLKNDEMNPILRPQAG